MFEKATRLKLRFDTPKGLLSVEDLWDLPLTSTVGKANLDDVAKALSRKLKAADEESFVAPSTNSAATADQLKFDIVKHIIGVRLRENEAKAAKAANKEELARLQEIIASKQDEALKGLTLEELQARAKQLAAGA